MLVALLSVLTLWAQARTPEASADPRWDVPAPRAFLALPRSQAARTVPSSETGLVEVALEPILDRGLNTRFSFPLAGTTVRVGFALDPDSRVGWAVLTPEDGRAGAAVKVKNAFWDGAPVRLLGKGLEAEVNHRLPLRDTTVELYEDGRTLLAVDLAEGREEFLRCMTTVTVGSRVLHVLAGRAYRPGAEPGSVYAMVFEKDGKKLRRLAVLGTKTPQPCPAGLECGMSEDGLRLWLKAR